MICKSYPEFQESVSLMIRELPLKELFFIPDSVIDDKLNEWLNGDDDTDPRDTQSYKDYRTYMHMLMTIPDDMRIPQPDDIIFKYGRKVVYNIFMTLEESKYYDAVLKNDTNPEDVQYLRDVLEGILKYVEESVNKNGITIDGGDSK